MVCMHAMAPSQLPWNCPRFEAKLLEPKADNLVSQALMSPLPVSPWTDLTKRPDEPGGVMASEICQSS